MRTALPFWIASTAIFVAACGGNEASSTDTAAEPVTSVISLEPKTPGTDFPNAAIKDWNYKSGRFTYAIDTSSYQLGVQTSDVSSTMCANSAQGQHVHLIVDNEPYIAKYESSFEQEVADGDHYFLTFLSRSYHESIKTDAAHRAIKTTVTAGSFGEVATITEPMLFYSRPKGEYVGKDTESVLLDFYPVNAPLGADFKVMVQVGDFSTTLDTWQPYLLKGLPMGENTVTLTLLDGAGQKVETPLNPVSRTFTLVPDPAPAM